MLAPTYPIETDRLLLRPLDPAGDVAAIHAYQSLPEVCRYIPFEPRTREQIAERLRDPERVRWALLEPGQALDLAIATYEQLLQTAQHPEQRRALEQAVTTLTGWRF